MASNRDRQQNVPPYQIGDQQMSPNFFEQNGISPHSQLYCRTGDNCKLPFPVSTGHHSTPLYDRSNNFSQSPKYPATHEMPLPVPPPVQQTHQYTVPLPQTAIRGNGNQGDIKPNSYSVPPTTHMICRSQQQQQPLYDSNNNGSPCANCHGGMCSTGMANQNWSSYGSNWNSQMAAASSPTSHHHHHSQHQQQQQQMAPQSSRQMGQYNMYMGEPSYSMYPQQQQLMYDSSSGMGYYQGHYPHQQHQQQYMQHIQQQPQTSGHQQQQQQPHCNGLCCTTGSHGQGGGMYPSSTQSRGSGRTMANQPNFNRTAPNNHSMRKSW